MGAHKNSKRPDNDTREPELIIYKLLDQFEFHKEDTDEHSSGLERWGIMSILDGLALSIVFFVRLAGSQPKPVFAFLVLGASVLIVIGVWMFAKGASDSVFSEINRIGSSLSPYILVVLHVILLFVAFLSAIVFSVSHYVELSSEFRTYLMAISGSMLGVLLYASMFALQAPMRLVLVQAKGRFGVFRFELIVESGVVAISLGALVAVTADGDPAKVAPFGLAAILAIVGYYRFKITMAAENYRRVIKSIESVRVAATLLVEAKAPTSQNLENERLRASFRELQWLLTPNPFQVNNGVRSFSIWALCVVAAQRGAVVEKGVQRPFGGDRQIAVDAVMRLSRREFALGVSKVFQRVLDMLNSGYVIDLGAANSFKTLHEGILSKKA